MTSRATHLLALVLVIAPPACRDASPSERAASASPAVAPAPASAPAPTSAPAPAPALPHVETPWCSGDLTGLSPSVCYVVPDGELPSPRTLLIYLHGVIAPRGRAQDYVQGVVARAARAFGVVAIVPRGRRGIGPEKTRDYWAWPTTAVAHARYASELISEWNDARRVLEEALGKKFDRVWLAGSSNGAYFATVLALKGELVADGYGAISGGMRGGFTKDSISAPDRRSRAPFYIGYGSYDDAKSDPIALGKLLDESGWPHKIAKHRVSHGAHDAYMGEAFEYWRSAGAGAATEH